MVLSKLSVAGGPTDLDKSTARAFCACSKCWWGGGGGGGGSLDIFSLAYLFSSFSLSPGDGPI